MLDVANSTLCVFSVVLVRTGVKSNITGTMQKIHYIHDRIYLMKDMILNIKRKAIALDSELSSTELENQLIELKQQIKILDHYLDLQYDKMNKKEG